MADVIFSCAKDDPCVSFDAHAIDGVHTGTSLYALLENPQRRSTACDVGGVKPLEYEIPFTNPLSCELTTSNGATVSMPLYSATMISDDPNEKFAVTFVTPAGMFF